MEKLLEQKYCLVVEHWETPASKYPICKLGSAEIVRRRQPRGYYRMEGVAGYIFYVCRKPIQITCLKINNRIVMVDDPLHWIGMQKLAEHGKGRVLVGGLGLGLIVHALIKQSKVEKINVVEINKDVIELISPHLPKDERITITYGDVYRISPLNYDTIILDLWVGKGNIKMSTEMLSAYAYFKTQNPQANVYIWGHGSSWLNPAIDSKVHNLIPKEYWIQGAKNENKNTCH